MQRKEGGNNDQIKVIPKIRPTENQSGSSVIEEISINGEKKDPEKEIVSLDQSEKENAHLIQSDSGVEAGKEGKNQEKLEEDTDYKEEEEEGEIEMATPSMRKVRGIKSSKEVREQVTYKDKLQGSQVTLERLL